MFFKSRRGLLEFLFVFLFLLTIGQNKADAGWIEVGGKAIDIGIGKKGSVWMIGNSEVNDQGNKIYVRAGNTWRLVGGLHGVRIDVDPYGNPWVATKTGAIYKRQQGNWVRVPGRASDIGIGANGAVWILGIHRIIAAGDRAIYVLSGNKFSQIGGRFALKIDVDPRGTPYVVSSSRKISRRAFARWEDLPGKANDIGIGSNGTVWMVGNNGTYRWALGRRWQKLDNSGGLAISVDPAGRAWKISSQSSRIYRWQP